MLIEHLHSFGSIKSLTSVILNCTLLIEAVFISFLLEHSTYLSSIQNGILLIKILIQSLIGVIHCSKNKHDKSFFSIGHFVGKDTKSMILIFPDCLRSFTNLICFINNETLSITFDVV